MSVAAKMMIVLGLMLALAGTLLLLAHRIPFLGRLPGDMRLEGGRVTFYFPLVTCLLLSLALTIVLNLVAWMFLRR